MVSNSNLIDNFSSKSVIFKMLQNIGNIYIYYFEAFFAIINNLELLPSNSPPIGRNQVSKFELHEKLENFPATFNGRSRHGWKGELENN